MQLMSDYPLRTLHAGLGAAGLALLRVLAESPLYEVVGLVDPEAEALEAAQVEIGLAREDCFEDLAEAIAACDPDVVVVAVPVVERADTIIQVLASDLHVLSAAPLGATVDEVRQCSVISLNRGARLMMVPEEVPAVEWAAQFHAYVTAGTEPATSARRVLSDLTTETPRH